MPPFQKLKSLVFGTRHLVTKFLNPSSLRITATDSQMLYEQDMCKGN